METQFVRIWAVLLQRQSENKFDNPRKRNINARFRRHPLKLGNMTVDLMNYHPENKDQDVAKTWYVGVFFGTGDNHKVKILKKKELPIVEKILSQNFPRFSIYKKFVDEISKRQNLQKSYEEDLYFKDKGNPIEIVKVLAEKIKIHDKYFKEIETNGFFPKETVPLAQIMAMYGLLKLVY